MRCPSCDTENRAGARFCRKCASKLVLVCSQCGAELPADAEFCDACGTPLCPAAQPTPPRDPTLERLLRQVPKEYAERLLATRGQPHDERRTVTILFSDIKGSTAFISQLDPEDAKEIILGAFEFLIAPVFRYEGTLVQLMGDAILAFFGAPIAHEDDPERAIRAALDITAEAAKYAKKIEEERGIEGFNVRVGINTGLVVVGEVGTDLRVAYTAVGDAINLAARMEQNAEPGTVLITEATFKLVAPLFETQAMPPLQVKGKDEPLQTYRVLGAKPVAGKVRGIAGLESPLVGRESELAALREAVERLKAGVGGIVTIVGEAGLGKSRLVAEARKRAPVGAVREPPLPLRWVEGRCLSYGTSVAYLLWLDVLRGLLGVTLEDSPERMRDILRERVQALCPDAAEGHFPYLARLLSLPLDAAAECQLRDLDGQQLKANTFAAMEALLSGAASARPLAIVLEDMHWADPSSLELLERLLALTDRASVLFVCAFRPQPEHGSWRIRETAASAYGHRHTDLRLRPLSNEESVALLGNLLDSPTLPAAFGERVLRHAEGNPFYVEEILRSLIGSGALVRDQAGRWQLSQEVEELPIPETLQGVLLARIDRLQEDTKRVLQMAAVIGRSFLYRLLNAIARQEKELDAHLLTLQREQMIRERARIPELEYIFKHHLTQEAAYHALLKAERRRLHRQVAEALEHLFPERVEEQLGLLAYHWELVGDAAKATHYLLRAGDETRLAYAHEEAIDYYERALRFLDGEEDPEPAARTWIKLGLTYHTAFDFRRSREAYDKGFALWQRAGGVPLAVSDAPHALRLLSGEPTSLDPAQVSDHNSVRIIGQLFTALVQFTAELDVVPDAARSWEILDGGRTYVFRLRPDMQWSDGHPLTAGDFCFGLQRTVQDARQSGADILGLDIKGVNAYLRGQLDDVTLIGVRARDDATLVIELEEPTSYVLQQLALLFAVPRHAVASHGQSWTEVDRIVTSGPFRLAARQPGKRLVLERNTRYHGRFYGNVQRVEVRIRPGEGAEIVEAYERGELDAAELNSLLPAELDRVRQKHAGEYVAAPELSVFFMDFDLTRPPFNDARVRRAFVLAVDREFLMRGTEDYAAPATGGIVPPGMPGHSPGIALPYDPRAARDLLAKAGYGAGGRQPLPQVDLWHPSLLPITETVDYFIGQWRQILDVEVRVESMEWGAYLARVEQSLPHVWFGGWVADYPDPHTFLQVGLAQNRRGWPRQPYEELLEAARRVTDQPQRLQLYRQADRMAIEDAVVLPFAYGRQHLLLRPWVKRYPVFYIGAPLWKDVVIEGH